MIRLAFFDVDGTLSAPYFRQPDGSLDLGLTEEGWLQYCAREKEDAYRYCEPVIPVRAYARKLRAEGVTLYVLSRINSTDEIAAKEKFIETHYTGLFEAVLTVDDDAQKVEVIKRIAGERGVALSECELVEDTFANLLYAFWNGIRGTHVAHLMTEKALVYEGLLKHDDVHVSTHAPSRPRNYRELNPNPDLPVVYPTPRELAFSVDERLSELFEEKPDTVILVGIDGRCGSGKTSFAALLRRIYGCEVLHTDDFYLPFPEREENWQEIPAGNMDLAAIRRTVEEHWEQKKQMMRPDSFFGERLLILEGSYAHHPKLRSLYDLRVFMTCDKEEQKRRLLPRERDNFPSFEEIWIPMEERYFHAFDVEETADILLNT